MTFAIWLTNYAGKQSFIAFYACETLAEKETELKRLRKIFLRLPGYNHIDLVQQ